MDFITIFREFGYPALITGFLLWMFATRLEKVTASNERLTDEVIKLQNEINRLRDELARKGVA